MSTGAIAALGEVSPKRRRRDKRARTLLAVGTGIALVPLVLILFFLVQRGFGSLFEDSFFSSDPSGNILQVGASGGVKSAILGTLEMVALASVMAIPIGVAVAVWLVEYGKRAAPGAGFWARANGWLAAWVRYFIDVMTGVPSIVFGLFVFVILVAPFGVDGPAAWKGSLALALLMLPVVTRAAEVVLLLVPNGLRESALALGAPRWRVIARIVLPTALPGIVTGSLLAVARAMGETAPLLYTAQSVNGTTADLGERMNSLPLQIFNDFDNPFVRGRTWGAALTLVLLVLLLTTVARFIARRSRLA